jgi:hypothetical protein
MDKFEYASVQPTDYLPELEMDKFKYNSVQPTDGQFRYICLSLFKFLPLIN